MVCQIYICYKTPKEQKFKEDNIVLGYNNILRIKLLRVRLKQRSVSEVGGSSARHSFRTVYSSNWKDETTDFQAEDRSRRVICN